PTTVGDFQIVTLTRADGVIVPWTRVHALVLMAWLGEKAARLPVWHGCRGPRDNGLSNLRLSRSPRSLTLDRIADIVDALATGHSIAATARLCGVGRRSVTKILRRFAPRRKTAEAQLVDDRRIAVR